MTTAKTLRIKAAQHQLICACGSVEDLLDEHPGLGRTSLFNWKDINHKALMPLDVVMKLEAHCGRPIVTEALAEIAGRKLVDPDAGVVSSACVMTRHADAIIQASHLMSVGAAAFADGRITPNEATGIDRAAAQLQEAISEYRKALAGIRADGGFSVVKGGAA